MAGLFPSPSLYPRLLNLRVYVPNRFESRMGSTLVSRAASPLHSIRRINDSVPGAPFSFARVVGGGSSLYVGELTLAQVATGFSGNPLALVPYRPPQSPETWMYVGDSAKTGKVRADGTFGNMGIGPPLSPPTTALRAPLVTTLESGLVGIGAWTNGGTAGAITASATGRISTTITAIVYDQGTTGWASIEPALVTGLGAGSLVELNPGGGTDETVALQAVFSASGSTTIASIVYDSGSSGLCTIQPASMVGMAYRSAGLLLDTVVPDRALSSLKRGVLVSLGGLETLTVLSVTPNRDGTASFRCSTHSTHAAGESVTWLPTVRAFLANTHASGETLRGGSLAYSVTAGTGTVSRAGAFDLAFISTRPTQEEDEFHVSIFVSDLTQLVEGRALIDVDASVNNFTNNFYYFAFRSNDLQSAASGQQTLLSARQQAIERAQIDAFGNIARSLESLPAELAPVTLPLGRSSDQTSTGATQWTELRFKVSDMQRFGSDTSRNLSNVAAIALQLQVLGTVSAALSSFTLHGAFGPDVGFIGDDYVWRTRYRSSTTGAVSNPGPPERSGLRPHREAVTVTAVASADPQVDTIDYERFGGVLPDWKIVGSSSNSSPSFSDVYEDSEIVSAPAASFDDYRPFPTVDIPHSGTATVTGTRVTRLTGDNFNTLWVPGNIIELGGVAYLTYNFPPDSSHLDLVTGAGYLASTTWLVREATLDAQPLPALWGPWFGSLFSCGDLYQPGWLFFTQGNNADSAPDTHQFEVTSPSEPLQNGVLYGNQNFLFSSERMFVILPGGDNLFQAQPVSGSEGIYSRWGLTVGDRIYGISRTGIWMSDGGAQVYISDPALTLLFPHDGGSGQPVSLGGATVQPPDFSKPAALRLDFEDKHLKFRYIDTTGARSTLWYSTVAGVWGIDTRAFGEVTGYAEEGASTHSNLIGGADGNLYAETGLTDNGAAFTSDLRMAQDALIAPSFALGRDGFVGMQAEVSASPSLVVNVDGVDYSVALPLGSGSYQKSYVVLPPLKGKVWEWGVTSTSPWKLWASDTAFRVKEWAADRWSSYRPFVGSSP